MAVRTAQATISLSAQATIRNQLDDLSIVSATVGGQIVRGQLTNGVEDNQLNRIWQKKDIAILSGNFRSFNLNTMGGDDIGAGTGLDGLGQTADIQEIVLLYIKNKSGTGVLEINPTIPGAAAIAWMPQYAINVNGGGIRSGGGRLWYEPGHVGLDISASSAVIHIGAAAGDVVAEMYLWGRSDDDASSSSSDSSSSDSTSSVS